MNDSLERSTSVPVPTGPDRDSHADWVLMAPACQLVMQSLALQVATRGRTKSRLVETADECLHAAALPRTRCIVLALDRFELAHCCRSLRLSGILTPILALTAEPGSLADHDALLVAGADRVLATRDPRRVLAQMDVIMRRARGAVTSLQSCGPVRLDRERRRATIQGVWLDLSPAEFDVLSVMCTYPSSPVRLEELSSELLGRAPSGSDRKALVQRILRLRHKLGRWADLIESHNGAYSFRANDDSRTV